MYQWLKSSSLKRPICEIEEDNTVNDMNKFHLNNSLIYLSKEFFYLLIRRLMGAYYVLRKLYFTILQFICIFIDNTSIINLF